MKSAVVAGPIMWWLMFRLSVVQSFVTRAVSSAPPQRAFQSKAFGRLAATSAVIETNATIGSEVKPSTETIILADAPDFIKPDRDLREYRVIKLANNLQVMLVSTAKSGNGDDDSARVEAASMHIQAGHFDDTLPGLAHFYEHSTYSTFLSRLLLLSSTNLISLNTLSICHLSVLFLGTKKYPDEDEYEGYLSRLGGFANAYT